MVLLNEEGIATIILTVLKQNKYDDSHNNDADYKHNQHDCNNNHQNFNYEAWLV